MNIDVQGGFRCFWWYKAGILLRHLALWHKEKEKSRRKTSLTQFSDSNFNLSSIHIYVYIFILFNSKFKGQVMEIKVARKQWHAFRSNSHSASVCVPPGPSRSFGSTGWRMLEISGARELQLSCSKISASFPSQEISVLWQSVAQQVPPRATTWQVYCHPKMLKANTSDATKAQSAQSLLTSFDFHLRFEIVFWWCSK